jgi:hypothetical protein
MSKNSLILSIVFQLFPKSVGNYRQKAIEGEKASDNGVCSCRFLSKRDTPHAMGATAMGNSG